MRYTVISKLLLWDSSLKLTYYREGFSCSWKSYWIKHRKGCIYDKASKQIKVMKYHRNTSQIENHMQQRLMFLNNTEREKESRFTNTPKKLNINGKQMCFYFKCRTGKWKIDQLAPERKGERARSRFAYTPNKQNLNGKQMCFHILCRTK